MKRNSFCEIGIADTKTVGKYRPTKGDTDPTINIFEINMTEIFVKNNCLNQLRKMWFRVGYVLLHKGTGLEAVNL